MNEYPSHWPVGPGIRPKCPGCERRDCPDHPANTPPESEKHSEPAGALRHKVRALQDRLGDLPASDRDFAASLCEKYWRLGATPKQAYWLNKLHDRLDAPEPSTESVDFSEVYRVMATAAEKLQYPKITLDDDPEAGRVQFYRAGPKSKFPGVVNITDGGRYGSNRWYGRVHPDGRWETGRDGVPDAVRVLVERFAKNPAGVAAEHGKATGRCCFCHLELETPESLGVGYGPVCAKNYGLPWGARAVA